MSLFRKRVAGSGIFIAFLFAVASLHAQDINPINDTFMLEGNIQIAVAISGNNGILTIAVTITNNGDEKVVLNKNFLDWYPVHLADEKGNRGKWVISPNRAVYTTVGVLAKNIDTIKSGETKTYATRRKYERTASRFVLYHPYFDGDYNFFENAKSVSIIIFNRYYPSEISTMQSLVEDAVLLPDFSKAYVLAEFE